VLTGHDVTDRLALQNEMERRALYPDPAARIEAATTANATAAIVAVYGPIYDPASLGGIALFKLTTIGAAITFTASQGVRAISLGCRRLTRQ